MITIIIMVIRMHTDLALTRLLQLVSPSLPIGGYTYSQGIEWAVEAGWVSNTDDLEQWVQGLMESNMANLELPLLLRMLDAWRRDDAETVDEWSKYLIASRETRELRQEESNRARAFYQVLLALEESAADHRSILLRSQHACYSFACARWGIDDQQASNGLLWSWLENIVLSAVKIIPLGQTAGQHIIFRLSQLAPGIIRQARQVEDADIGASSMAQVIASARHENQYTRLFRS